MESIVRSSASVLSTHSRSQLIVEVAAWAVLGLVGFVHQLLFLTQRGIYAPKPSRSASGPLLRFRTPRRLTVLATSNDLSVVNHSVKVMM